MQIVVHTVQGDRFQSQPLHSHDPVPDEAVWIEIHNPSNTAEAVDYVERLGLRLDMMEAAQNFDLYGHVEIDDQQVTALLRAERRGQGQESSKLAVVLGRGKLVTVAVGPTPAIDQAGSRLSASKPDTHPPTQILARILELALDRASQILDEAEDEVRLHSHQLFGSSSVARAEIDLEHMLSELGPKQARIVEVRYTNGVVARLLHILLNDPRVSLSSETREALEGMASEFVSLKEFAGTIERELANLVDLTVGYIGIRQNASARWFSIVATVFMPPTLLAAIWGMNFQHMPELDDSYGYALALGLMLLSATIPLWVVRKLGWLSR